MMPRSGERLEICRLRRLEVGIKETMNQFATLRDAGRLDTSDIEAELKALDRGLRKNRSHTSGRSCAMIVYIETSRIRHRPASPP